MKNLSIVVLVAVLACMLYFSVRQAHSQGSGSTRIPNTGTRPYQPPVQPRRQQTPEEFYRTFWTHLQDPKLPYTKWARFPAGDKDPRKGEPPHGTQVRIYANKVAAADPKLPYDAVLVAENLAEDGRTLQSLSVMYRVRGIAPKAGDWYFLQYDPKGVVVRDEQKKAIAGAVKSCTDCHLKSQGRDLVYTNDPVEELPPSDGKPKSEEAPLEKDASKGSPK